VARLEQIERSLGFDLKKTGWRRGLIIFPFSSTINTLRLFEVAVIPVCEWVFTLRFTNLRFTDYDLLIEVTDYDLLEIKEGRIGF
jgi:hypothetical protein